MTTTRSPKPVTDKPTTCRYNHGCLVTFLQALDGYDLPVIEFEFEIVACHRKRPSDLKNGNETKASVAISPLG